MTAVVGWHWFDVATYQANWNTSSTTDSHAVIKSILLLLVGLRWRRDPAAVSTGMVKNPKRTVPLATMLGTAMAGIVYIAATRVIAGMYPASQMAASGAPFAISASTIPRRLGCTDGIRFHRLCLPDFSGLVDDAGWPGRCACRQRR